MESVLRYINGIIWGFPVLIMILAVGIILTIRTGAAQIRLLPDALSQLIRSFRKRNKGNGNFSSYRALCTALAATVGTGNIAGVAGAIALGGPGVVFWMWICAILGMIIKCAEVMLAMHFRQKDPVDGYIGGPMYMIEHGLPRNMHFLAVLYCCFGVVAALGVGNATQINAVTEGIGEIAHSLNLPFDNGFRILIGLLAAIIIFSIFRQGTAGIGQLAEQLIPLASILYIIIALLAIVLRLKYLPVAFRSILIGAIQPKAISGGALCSLFLTVRIGVSRGIFTNEAGMGTASIAHASSQAQAPIEQGLMGVMEVFLDTILICTLTALVILCSGIAIPYGTDPGIELTLKSFSSILGDWSSVIITALVCLFAFATILGWGLYGGRCCRYLFGNSGWIYFVYAQSATVLLGAYLKTSVIWEFSEFVNGLMSIPNLIALVLLSGVFVRLLKESENAYRH